MAECPDGRTNRGTRSQFRIGLPGLGICKGFYPINLGKIMDAGQSSQISSSSSRDLISPCKGTHTLTVREYEQTIDELKKENFQLKLKIYMCEETHQITGKNKDSSIPNDEMVQVLVNLTSDFESVRAELKEKESLLQNALERAEKLELDFKELEKINADLQSEITSFSELPSKEEILLLLEEKKNFVDNIETLESIIKEKDEEIDLLNQKIEILANENTRLEEKVKKRSLAIQSFVYKSYKEKEMLPDEFKETVISAIQAAKNKNKDDLAVALKTFTSAVNKIMSTSDQSKEKENIESPRAKCLKEEVLEKSTESFLSSHTESPSHIAQVQGLKEVLSERNIPDTNQTKKLDSFVHHPFLRGKMVHQNAVNISEKDVIEFCDISPREEKLISFSERPSLQTCHVTEHNLNDIEIISPNLKIISPMLIPEKDISESNHLVNISKENEQLKFELKKKLEEIKELGAACEELKGVRLQETGSYAFKASQQCCVSTQTKIAGSSLLDEYGIIKLEKDLKLSDNVEELKENILLLMLSIEEKNKELSEVKQSLAAVQEDLKKASTNLLDKDFYMLERNELHERLASSCSINEKLMKHLKSLEKFMEDLLQHKFDSSLESIADKSDFISNVSKCLAESLNLSRVLSDNLSVCEGSKLFEECESSVYKNDSFSGEKDLPYLGLDRLSMPGQSSYGGSRTFEEYISYAQKNNLKVGKESDSSQLCWRCWQQVNSSNQSEFSHLMQNNSIVKPAGYQSSDSDIWSEPDRNISMQRIGISLQNSPVSSKSPRKLRQKDKRSSRISSKEDTSSSEYQQASKKRQGSASRRLFSKDNAKTQDFAIDKFYFLVAEKYARLKSLLDELESINDGKLSNDGWIRLNMLVLAVGETLQKLHFAKENAKTSPICGKCAMLELFSNIKISHVETDFSVSGTSSEHKILREFSKEIHLLKQACKEPFSLLHETTSKKSIASQSDILNENEQIRELENIVNSLTDENKELNGNLEKIQQMLSEEKEKLLSVKSENSKLLNKIDNLKIDLLDMKYKEKELSLKNEKLEKELSCVIKNNSELNITLKDLEQKRKESNIALDQLTVELEKKKSDLINMNEKCLNFERQLNEQIHMTENSENKLKSLESESQREKEYYLHKIEDLNAEKSHYIQELKAIEEKRIALEKENAVISDRLESKNNELLSLKRTIEKFQSIKETGNISSENIALESIKTENVRLLNEINHLKEQVLNLKYKEKEFLFENKKLDEELDHVNKKYSELNSTLEHLKEKNNEFSSTVDQLKAKIQKNESDLDYMNKKCLTYKEELNEQTKMKEKYENQLKTIEFNSLNEKENYIKQLDVVNTEKNLCEQELKNVKERMLALERENAVVNHNLQLKIDELLSLRKAVPRLQNAEKTQVSIHKATKELLSKSEELPESSETENLKLLNHIKQLEEKLSFAKNKEKDLCLKNQELVNELTCLRKCNSELDNTLKDLEMKRKESCTDLNQLNVELQKNKSDLIHMNEKCIEYEKELNKQIHMREDSENKLKNLESESLSEKNYYLHKIEDLNTERNQCLEDLKILQEEKLSLEKENAVLNDRLQHKNDEILSLKGTIEKLQTIKESQSDVENELVSKERIIFESIKIENSRLSKELNQLKEELLDKKYKEKELSIENKKLNEELSQITKNYSELNSTLKDLEQKEKESNSTADQLKAELQKSTMNLDFMNKKCLENERQMNEQLIIKEKLENQLKTLKLNTLHEKENYQNQIEILTTEKNNYEQELENIKGENFKLLNEIHQLEELLSHMKNEEKELYLENTKLAEKLEKVSKGNSDLNNTIKILEQKKKYSDAELDHLSSELQKNQSDLLHLSEKCLAYEKQLNEQIQLREKCESELKSQKSTFMSEKEHYLSQINDLNLEKNDCLQKLKSVQEEKLVLEKEITAINDKLQSKNKKLLSLQETIKELQKAKAVLESNYKGLQLEFSNNQESLTNLQEKCEMYEKVISNLKESESEHSEQLKELEGKSISEKEKLLNEISILTKEKEDLLQKLKNEKELYKKLKSENIELSKNFKEVSQQVSTLKQRNDFFENALISSNKECDSLNKDLKSLRNMLQNLESKCLTYEKQLVATTGMKDNLTECLLNINNEFSAQRQKLNDVCKMYGNDESVVLDETSSKFIPLIDEENVSKLCESVTLESKKLLQSVDMLLSILKNYHLKHVEIETSEEKNHIKTQSLKKQIDLKQSEIENLRLQNDRHKQLIDELQKAVSEKEKSIQSNSYQIKILKEKLQNSQKEIDRENQLIQRKDDEITMLQERIFNLQTYVNNIITDKENLFGKTTSMIEKPEDFLSSNSQLPVSTDNKTCQTDECEGINQSIDESFTSASSFESSKNRCCEKYWKKCYSLQAKLALCRKHIEILEKEKNDLRERSLQQLQNKKDTSEKNVSAKTKLEELETKLEKKKLFICELKNELLRTCNSLIDKEKELDDLKQKLAECEVKFKYEIPDVSKIPLSSTLSSVDANVKTLKNHKWKLIQTVFDIQRKFYEKKGIHLNYFDRFKEHVNKLYSLQLTPSVSKSESMPVLKSLSLEEHYPQGNEKIKKIADLELDIECLENLKIFLNRFLVPCVFETSQTFDKETGSKQKTASSDRLSLPIKIESQSESKQSIADILNLSFPETFTVIDKEKDLSIDIIASTIFQHLDCIKKFLDAVKERNWLDILDFSAKDSVEKAEVKSLLLKIFQEINDIRERANKLFDFNTHLKSFDFVTSLQAPLSTTKLDTSDRESIMSEETIAVSRTESPLSFEDICPIKLPHPETLQLEENTMKTGSVGNRVTVIESYGTKMTVVDGSCDSVCQRSHYSSPDLGIESDPNHDSSAPEHKEDGANKYQIFPFKLQPPKTVFTTGESAGRWPGPKFGETCYAISTLPDFELLKQEVKESLVAIKSVLSRTGDGLHHIAKYTSPRKTLEYNTLKSIKDTCVHMEACLKQANNLVGKFWTAPCPTEKEWKILKEENQKLHGDLLCLRNLVEKQEIEFKAAMGKLERAQAVKDNIEKKISKKLVKTKKLIRQAELKLLENRCQNFPPVPKFPSEQTEPTDAH